jgi:hypothetical protein
MTRKNPLPSPETPPGGVTRYRDRIFDDKRIDPYHARGKYHEPTACTDCTAVFHRGRWVNGSAPEGARRDRCPACRRIRDNLPAGSVTLEGSFYADHRAELLQLVRHEAEKERSEHPLNRVMRVEEFPDRAIVSTTDIHTPHRIGTALKHAYQGELDLRYGHDEYSIQVVWRR